MSSMQLSSSSAAKWATPDLAAWDMAPPSSSIVTSSPVTVLMTFGPVMNMCEVSLTMYTKSVMAGEYTAPPAQGPMMALICGITPDVRTLRRKMSPYPPRLTTPSWMRAPPESFSPTTGTPIFAARSMILTTFSAKTSPSDPPKAVKSWLNTAMRRPSTVPWPVMTASPRMCLSSMPKPLARWTAKASVSTKLPSSSSRWTRSRAVSLPLSCCLAIAFSPPPDSASAWRRSSSAIFSAVVLVTGRHLRAGTGRAAGGIVVLSPHAP